MKERHGSFNNLFIGFTFWKFSKAYFYQKHIINHLL